MLTIGQVAKAANVNVETVRYYQRRGLLPQPAKPLGGHRHYAADDVRRLQFIKRAQSLGFTLEDVESLLSWDGTDCCEDSRDLAVRKLAVIDEKLAQLAAMRLGLAGLIEQCVNGACARECPLMYTLTQGQPPSAPAST